MIMNNSCLTNNCNSSVVLKSESFAESFIPQPESSVQVIDVKKLREKFNKMFETVKKAAQGNDEVIMRIENTESDESLKAINNNNLYKEEEPMNLQLKPMQITNNNIARREGNKVNNALQTSLMNFNDEIRDDNISGEKSFISMNEEIFTPYPKLNFTSISAKKLDGLRENLERSARPTEITSTTQGQRKYKGLLCRAREKSQEQANELKKLNQEKIDDIPIKKKKEMIISRDIQITFQTQDPTPISKPETNVNNLQQTSFDTDHDSVISLLNSGNHKDLINYHTRDGSRQLSKLEDLYDDNLLDLIEEIENGSCGSKSKQRENIVDKKKTEGISEIKKEKEKDERYF